MVRGDTTELENYIPIKYNVKKSQFFYRGGGRNPSYLGRNVA